MSGDNSSLSINSIAGAFSPTSAYGIKLLLAKAYDMQGLQNPGIVSLSTAVDTKDEAALRVAIYPLLKVYITCHSIEH